SAADPLDVVVMLEQEAERGADQVRVEIVGPQVRDRLGPVDGLGGARQLRQILAPEALDECHDTPPHVIGEPWNPSPDDLDLLLQRRVVDPVIEAATLERVVDVAGTVGREHDDGPVARRQGAELWDRDLEIAEKLEEEALEFLVGAIELVDEQHGRSVVGRVDGLQEGTLEEGGRPEAALRGDARSLAASAAGLQLEELARIVPLIGGLGDVEPLVALEPDETGLEKLGEHAREQGLAHAGRALEKERPAHPE